MTDTPTHPVIVVAAAVEVLGHREMAKGVLNIVAGERLGHADGLLVVLGEA